MYSSSCDRSYGATPCWQTKRPNAHRARFFGDVVDLVVKASCRRYSAEGADLRSLPLQARRGRASVKKMR